MVSNFEEFIAQNSSRGVVEIDRIQGSQNAQDEKEEQLSSDIGEEIEKLQKFMQSVKAEKAKRGITEVAMNESVSLVKDIDENFTIASNGFSGCTGVAHVSLTDDDKVSIHLSHFAPYSYLQQGRDLLNHIKTVEGNKNSICIVMVPGSYIKNNEGKYQLKPSDLTEKAREIFKELVGNTAQMYIMPYSETPMDRVKGFEQEDDLSVVSNNRGLLWQCKADYGKTHILKKRLDAVTKKMLRMMNDLHNQYNKNCSY